MNVVLLPDSLGHQLALAGAQRFLAAHHLAPPVPVHLDAEGRVDDAIPTQHLTCVKHLTHSHHASLSSIAIWYGSVQTKSGLTKVLSLVEDGVWLAER